MIHALPAEALDREIQHLRAQAEACSNPTDLLQVARYHGLLHKLLRLSDELTRQRAERFSKERKSRKALYSWRQSSRPSRSISAKLNKAAAERMRLVLELPA